MNAPGGRVVDVDPLRLAIAPDDYGEGDQGIGGEGAAIDALADAVDDGLPQLRGHRGKEVDRHPQRHAYKQNDHLHLLFRASSQSFAAASLSIASASEISRRAVSTCRFSTIRPLTTATPWPAACTAS